MRTDKASATTHWQLKISIGCLMVGLMAAQTQNARAAEDQAPAVKIGLSQLNSEVNNLRESLKGTMSALEDLKTAANKNDDLNKPFSGFSSAYAELETQVAKLREHGTAVKARAKEHWDNWQKELTDMQNAKLREKAQKRYTATSGEFQKIIEKVGDAKEGFAPLAADLKDINTYLKTDLSKEAVSSLGNTIWKMGNQARSVDGKLADVNKQIERTMSKLPQT